MKTQNTTANLTGPKCDYVTAVLNRDLTDEKSLSQARAEHAALVAVAEVAGKWTGHNAMNRQEQRALNEALGRLAYVRSQAQ